MSTTYDASSPHTSTLLNSYNFIILFLILITFSVLYQVIYYRFLHPLRHFPGPFLASVTRLYIAYHNFLGHQFHLEYSLHEQYGPVIRITPTMLLVSDATKLSDIYFRQAHKSKHYSTGNVGEGDLTVNIRDYKTHAYYRKFAAGPYAFSNIKKMEYLFDLHISNWLAKLNTRFADSGKPFDFVQWSLYLVYDIMSDIGFGAPFGFIQDETDIGGLIQSIRASHTITGLMAILWPITDFITKTPIRKYLVPTPASPNGIGVAMRFRDTLIEQRQKDIADGNKNDRFDLLQRFLDTRDENGKPLNEEYMKAEILGVLIGGADTTGAAMQALIHHVVTRPDVYSRLMEEINEQSSKGNLSEMAQFDEVLAHCPYYVACVKESLRLSPPVPGALPRLVCEDGLSLFNHHVPAGTEIACSAWVIQRDKNVYGPDACQFQPERWIESKDKATEYNKSSLVFGYGARVCLGRHIALMELYKAPLQFFRTYKPQLRDANESGLYIAHGIFVHWENLWITI